VNEHEALVLCHSGNQGLDSHFSRLRKDSVAGIVYGGTMRIALYLPVGMKVGRKSTVYRTDAEVDALSFENSGIAGENDYFSQLAVGGYVGTGGTGNFSARYFT